MLKTRAVLSFALWFAIGFLVSQLRINYLFAYNNRVLVKKPDTTTASQVLQNTPAPANAIMQGSTLAQCTLKFDKYASSEIERAFLQQAKHNWHDAKQMCGTVMQWKPVIDDALKGSNNQQYFSYFFFNSTCSSQQVVYKIEPLAGVDKVTNVICSH